MMNLREPSSGLQNSSTAKWWRLKYIFLAMYKATHKKEIIFEAKKWRGRRPQPERAPQHVVRKNEHKYIEFGSEWQRMMAS